MMLIPLFNLDAATFDIHRDALVKLQVAGGYRLLYPLEILLPAPNILSHGDVPDH
jgi:hypothetical protein